MIVADDEYLVVRVIEALSRVLYRYRSELAPFWLAAATASIGLWLHAMHADWAPPLAAATAAAAAALSVLPGRTRVIDARWLARRSERLYAVAVVVMVGGWLSAAAAFGPTTRPLPALGVAATLVGAVPWWAHRRRRARVRVERALEAWPEVAEVIGLGGSRVVSAVVDAWGWTARIALRRGHTVSAAVDRIPAIESGLSTRPGAIRIEADPARADRLLMRVVETDPHAEPIPFPGAPPTSISQPVELGLFEDGQPVRVRLAHRNALIGGIVGSGKSGVLNVLLAYLTACRDVAVCGIDLKGGMELRPWQSCLARLATTPDNAVALLADTARLLDEQALQMGRDGQRLWEPVPDAPALVVVIDEYAELPEQAMGYADSIARRGRAVGVTLLVATQRPTQKAMGHGAVRSQMDVRVCLRVRERRDADLILGQGMQAAGWSAESLNAPGKFLISAPEHDQPRRARAYHLTDAAVQATAGTNRAHRPSLTLPSSEDRSAAEEPATTVVIPRPRTPTDVEDPETVLWVALRGAQAEGISVSELSQITGMSRSWVYYRVQQHVSAGRALRTTRGRWRGLGTGT
jgi:S-DNA-T family DNA segregation ATPase FtsK/SpoIIIE